MAARSHRSVWSPPTETASQICEEGFDPVVGSVGIGGDLVEKGEDLVEAARGAGGVFWRWFLR